MTLFHKDDKRSLFIFDYEKEYFKFVLSKSMITNKYSTLTLSLLSSRFFVQLWEYSDVKVRLLTNVLKVFTINNVRYWCVTGVCHKKRSD